MKYTIVVIASVSEAIFYSEYEIAASLRCLAMTAIFWHFIIQGDTHNGSIVTLYNYLVKYFRFAILCSSSVREKMVRPSGAER